MSGLVYALVEGDLNVHRLSRSDSALVKIGFTTSPDAEARRRGCQTGNARPLVVFKELEAPNGQSDELRLHHALEQYRQNGEWFDLPKSIISRLNFKRITSVHSFLIELPSAIKRAEDAARSEHSSQVFLASQRRREERELREEW